MFKTKLLSHMSVTIKASHKTEDVKCCHTKNYFQTLVLKNKIQKTNILSREVINISKCCHMRFNIKNVVIVMTCEAEHQNAVSKIFVLCCLE